MSSERCERALTALMGDSMPTVIDVVARASDADRARRGDAYAITFSSADLADACDGQPNRAMRILAALSDPFADALCVVMYAGRDEFTSGSPYDERDVETQFRDWWTYLGMEGERFAREQMAEKAPLGEYLRRGAYMFRIEIC